MEHNERADAPPGEELAEVVEVEEYGKQNKKPPRAKKYVLRIDKTKHEWPAPHITGRELLTLAKKDPSRCSVRQKFHGGHAKTIDLTETVDLAEPGIERFMTLCHDQTDG